MKAKRQAKLIELINTYEIETQDELASRLNAAGFNVTQATVSRDIRELNLSKVSVRGGRQKYALVAGREEPSSEKFARVLRDGFVSRDVAAHLIVIRTAAGMAMAVATAIDSMKIPGIVGCIAGDDTIFCAVRSEDDVFGVMRLIDEVVSAL